MRDAARRSKARTFVWFNYRRCPAVALAWQLVREGRLGRILHVRAHMWVSTPFQLVFWEILLATAVLLALAVLFEPVPDIAWSPSLIGLFLFASVFGVVVAYWAMAMVNRSLPAVTTSLGILATPVVGTLCSTIALGEAIDIALLVAMALILGGIAVGTIDGGQPAAPRE